MLGLAMDLGTFEFQPEADDDPEPDPCPFDDDGFVGAAELLALLGTWGTCP